MSCQICDCKEETIVHNINHICNNCGHIYIDGPEDLEKYYNEIYRNSSPLPDETLRTKFTNTILDKVKKVIYLQDKKIFEAGCADGLMSSIISQRFEIIKENFLCVDMDEKLTDKAAERGFKVWNTNILNILNVNYDLVFAIDILEHISDIQEVKRWLKNFKYAVIQLPRLRGPKQSFKAHFHTFTDKSLEIFLQDFKILGRWDTLAMETCFGTGYLLVIENE